MSQNFAVWEKVKYFCTTSFHTFITLCFEKKEFLETFMYFSFCYFTTRVYSYFLEHCIEESL